MSDQGPAVGNQHTEVNETPRDYVLSSTPEGSFATPSESVVTVSSSSSSSSPHSHTSVAKVALVDYFRRDAAKFKALLALLAAFTFAYINVSSPTPFLSDSMKDKGISEVWVGVVYAAHPLGMVASQFAAERVEKRVGNSVMLSVGFLFAGTCTAVTAFAFDITERKTSLLLVLILLRLATGLGQGLADTSIFNYYQILFPEVLGQVMGVSEGMIGLGIATGPLLGGVLYDASGWSLPFLAVAGPFFVIAFAAPYFVRPVEQRCVGETTALLEGGSCGGGTPRSGSIVQPEEKDSPARSQAMTYIVALGITVNCIGYGAIGPLLSQHLDDHFSLSKTLIGVIMGGSGVVYWLCGTFVGNACDRRAHRGNHSGSLFLWGFVVMTVGYLLIGPVPLPHVLDSAVTSKGVELSLVVVGLNVASVSMSFALICGMSIMTVRAKNTSLASAYFNGSLNLGYGIGPIAISAVAQGWGFRTAMTTCAGLGVGYMLVAFILLNYVYDMRQ